MIKSLALIGIFFGAVPFLLGLFYTGFLKDNHKEKNNILLHMVAGYILLFALFDMVAAPLIWFGASLSLLTFVYGGVVLLASAVSLFLHAKRIPNVIKGIWRALKRFTFCIWAQCFFLAEQIFIYIRYEYQNADDAFFVASAATSLATDTILAFNPYTGAAYETLPARYVLSPFHAFIAVGAKATDTHPAILAHMVFMILLLLLAYAVYALIGRALFGDDMRKLGYFLLFLSALHLFAGYSERTSGLFLLIRLWQGKAILAGILLPMVFGWMISMFFSNRKEGDVAKAEWFLLPALMFACCMVSSMGIMLGAIMAGLIGILSAWKEKSVKRIFYIALCCLPNMIYAGIYLAIR